ncbi:hypothetical protein BpHYR1_014706, partial [Brachionus plicatilis]
TKNQRVKIYKNHYRKVKKCEKSYFRPDCPISFNNISKLCEIQYKMIKRTEKILNLILQFRRVGQKSNFRVRIVLALKLELGRQKNLLERQSISQDHTIARLSCGDKCKSSTLLTEGIVSVLLLMTESASVTVAGRAFHSLTILLLRENVTRRSFYVSTKASALLDSSSPINPVSNVLTHYYPLLPL